MSPSPRTAAVALLLAVSLAAGAAARPDDTSLASYLPAAEYDDAVPTPASVLGWEVGTWHVRHDQLVRYMEALAEASPRVSIETYAHSHEQRPLVLLTITSPDNHARIDEIRAAHLEAVQEGRDRGADDPVVVQLGYSVHGNEASAGNAALLVAYHLAAADDPGVDLDSTVVLLDPCLNPDGFARFASWVNQHKGRVLVADAAHREHDEVWPGGRTNHYWFDLNRDWLLLTHPESRGRVRQFQRWRPHVLTDGHEMGTSSTYFFQPGVPTRQNPRTPKRNLDLTRRIAEYHAAALDELGTLYYSEERFDDFYYGKGSTYPDVHGSIGILFEQASARGHLQTNSMGELSFPDTIRNQVATSFSTLRAAEAMRDDLLAYQVETTRSALAEAREDPVRGYVYGDAHDTARVDAMTDILRAHRVRVHELADEITVDGTRYAPGQAYVVPCEQPQYRLVKSLFETRTEFEDDTFYDVSTWTLPLAFGLPYAALPSLDAAGDPSTSTTRARAVAGGPVPYAYALDWRSMTSPRALQTLLDAGVRVRVVTQPVEMMVGDRPREFPAGTLLVPRGIQDDDVRAELVRHVTRAGDAGRVDVHAISTGLTPTGVDLGSPSVEAVEPPRPLVVVGPGVSAYESGEVWHALDVRFGVATSLVEIDDLGRAGLGDFTHVVMVNGGYGAVSDGTADAIADWVRDGGTLIAQKGATSWAERHVLGGRSGGSTSNGDDDGDEPPARRPYGDYDDLRAVDVIGGAIFEVDVDLTHPLAFGYTRERLPVFRNSTRTLDVDRDPFSMPFMYTDEPLLSGYASDDNVAAIAGTPAVVANRVGRGLVVRIVDVPNFRGVFRGTERIFANAIFMSGAIGRTGPVAEAHDDAVDGHGHPDEH